MWQYVYQYEFISHNAHEALTIFPSIFVNINQHFVQKNCSRIREFVTLTKSLQLMTSHSLLSHLTTTRITQLFPTLPHLRGERCCRGLLLLSKPIQMIIIFGWFFSEYIEKKRSKESRNSISISGTLRFGLAHPAVVHLIHSLPYANACLELMSSFSATPDSEVCKIHPFLFFNVLREKKWKENPIITTTTKSTSQYCTTTDLANSLQNELASSRPPYNNSQPAHAERIPQNILQPHPLQQSIFSQTSTSSSPVVTSLLPPLQQSASSRNVQYPLKRKRDEGNFLRQSNNLEKHQKKKTKKKKTEDKLPAFLFKGAQQASTFLLPPPNVVTRSPIVAQYNFASDLQLPEIWKNPLFENRVPSHVVEDPESIKTAIQVLSSLLPPKTQ